MSHWYKEDLAYIHDVGFADYALGSAPGILEILDRNGIRGGLVVDLGCGSGLWAGELTQAGYRVLGIDISGQMIEIARERAPEAEFQVASVFEAELPACSAVTSVGEVLNYLFDPNNDRQALTQLFRNIYGALSPGGLFIFDIAEPGQIPKGAPTKGFTEGEGWVVLLEKEEDPELGTLTRRITSFRKVGDHYRRDDEVHRLQLYVAEDLAEELRRAGFQVRMGRGYGGYLLPKAHAAFVARKPA
jgi:SAM-dependent methyltransferase